MDDVTTAAFHSCNHVSQPGPIAGEQLLQRLCLKRYPEELATSLPTYPFATCIKKPIPAREIQWHSGLVPDQGIDRRRIMILLQVCDHSCKSLEELLYPSRPYTKTQPFPARNAKPLATTTVWNLMRSLGLSVYIGTKLPVAAAS